MSDENASEIDITSHYLRVRNALCLRAAFTPLFVDYYLHLMENETRYEETHDAMLKDAFMAMALHCASRPHDEITAWTIGFQEPRLNLFVTGNNRSRSVTGRVFTENTRLTDETLFFSQVLRDNAPARQSVVPVQGANLFAAVEQFYRQSQQLPARYFQMSDPEETAMVVAMPDCDLDWLIRVEAEEIEHLAETEDINLLETRKLYFGCECNLVKVVRSLTVLGKLAREELFEKDNLLQITCPRCGAKYQATQEDLEKSLQNE